MRQTCPECNADDLERHRENCSRDPHRKFRRPAASLTPDYAAGLTFHNPIGNQIVARKVSVDDDGVKVEPITAEQMYKAPDESELVFVDNGKMVNPVLTLQPQPINLSFHDDDGNRIGEFLYNKDKKQWTFDGNADESAKVFAKFMFSHFQSIIEGDRDGIMDAPIVAHKEEESEPEKVWPTITPGEIKIDGRYKGKL
jgi:hypothetical protein